MRLARLLALAAAASCGSTPSSPPAPPPLAAVERDWQRFGFPSPEFDDEALELALGSRTALFRTDAEGRVVMSPADLDRLQAEGLIAAYEWTEAELRLTGLGHSEFSELVFLGGVTPWALVATPADPERLARWRDLKADERVVSMVVIPYPLMEGYSPVGWVSDALGATFEVPRRSGLVLSARMALEDGAPRFERVVALHPRCERDADRIGLYSMSRGDVTEEWVTALLDVCEGIQIPEVSKRIHEWGFRNAAELRSLAAHIDAADPSELSELLAVVDERCGTLPHTWLAPLPAHMRAPAQAVMDALASKCEELARRSEGSPAVFWRETARVWREPAETLELLQGRVARIKPWVEAFLGRDTLELGARMELFQAAYRVEVKRSNRERTTTEVPELFRAFAEDLLDAITSHADAATDADDLVRCSAALQFLSYQTPLLSRAAFRRARSRIHDAFHTLTRGAEDLDALDRCEASYHAIERLGAFGRLDSPSDYMADTVFDDRGYVLGWMVGAYRRFANDTTDTATLDRCLDKLDSFERLGSVFWIDKDKDLAGYRATLASKLDDGIRRALGEGRKATAAGFWSMREALTGVAPSRPVALSLDTALRLLEPDPGDVDKEVRVILADLVARALPVIALASPDFEAFRPVYTDDAFVGGLRAMQLAALRGGRPTELVDALAAVGRGTATFTRRPSASRDATRVTVTRETVPLEWSYPGTPEEIASVVAYRAQLDALQAEQEALEQRFNAEFLAKPPERVNQERLDRAVAQWDALRSRFDELRQNPPPALRRAGELVRGELVLEHQDLSGEVLVAYQIEEGGRSRTFGLPLAVESPRRTRHSGHEPTGLAAEDQWLSSEELLAGCEAQVTENLPLYAPWIVLAEFAQNVERLAESAADPLEARWIRRLLLEGVPVDHAPFLPQLLE